MREMILIAEVIIPIFLLIMIGYSMKQTNVVSSRGAIEVNNIVFKYLLPCNLFINIYNSDFSTSFNFNLITFCLVLILIIFFATDFLSTKMITDNKSISVVAHAIFRSNFVIFGIVIINEFFPESAGLASIVSAFVVPLYNMLAVYLMEKHQNKGGGFKKVLLGILHNPLIIACFLASIINYSGLLIPSIPLKLINDLSKCATPIALLGIGMKFSFSSVKKHLKLSLVATASRLLIIPLICVILAILFGFRNETLLIILVLFGAPTAVSTYTMSLQYDVNHQLSGLLVVLTTLGSIITMYILITLLSLSPYLSLVP